MSTTANDRPRLAADAEAVGDFFDALFRYADEGTFLSLRAFDQKDRGQPPVLIEGVRVNGDFRPIINRAVAAADKAANGTRAAVFAPPIATFNNPTRARQEDLANGVALSVEMDGGDTTETCRRLEHLLGPATMVVASGGDWSDPETGEVHPKLHVHWRLSEPTRTAEEHAALYKARWLATALASGDKTAVPPCHPLRWPGSWHCKGSPRLSKIVGQSPEAEIHLDDALEKLAEAVEAAGLGTTDTASLRASGPPQAPIEDIVAALSHFPNDNLDWTEWNHVGMAAWRATGGSPEGYAAWEQWSAKSSKHNGGACLTRWKHFSISPPSRVGAGTLFFLAKPHGWTRAAKTPANVRTPAPTDVEQEQHTPAEEPLSEEVEAKIQVAEAAEAPRAKQYEGRQHFTPLGHDRGVYYFLPARGGQVVELKARDLASAGCLLQLAPIGWLESAFPGTREGFKVTAAADYLMRLCERIGVYDRSRIRGRGAWFDGGRAVLHLGDRLIVDGRETPLDGSVDGFIYERSRHMDVPTAEPLSDKEARRLLGLCLSLQWVDQKRAGTLFAGLIVVSMVCGALRWRPHAWLSGENGSGKTYVIENILQPLIGLLALHIKGKSSEAGIRGELGRDARPVVFDEAETQNQTDRQRMQGVLDLARQASSEDGGEVVKGTKDGGSRHYSIRSTFIFASINEGLAQAADESRTVRLRLALPADKNEREALFARTRRLYAEVMTAGLPARLLARTLQLLPVIRSNAETYAAAIARTGLSRRIGNTHGILLAGALSLKSSREITAEEADRHVKEGTALRESLERDEVTPEWRRALDHLAQQTIRVHNAHNRAEDATVGELLLASRGQKGPVFSDEATTALARIGIRWPPAKHVDNGTLSADTVLISRQSDRIGRWFEQTPWAPGWLSTLERTPGAAAPKAVFKFAGVTTRALAVPAAVLLGDKATTEEDAGGE